MVAADSSALTFHALPAPKLFSLLNSSDPDDSNNQTSYLGFAQQPCSWYRRFSARLSDPDLRAFRVEIDHTRRLHRCTNVCQFWAGSLPHAKPIQGLAAHCPVSTLAVAGWHVGRRAVLRSVSVLVSARSRPGPLPRSQMRKSERRQGGRGEPGPRRRVDRFGAEGGRYHR